MWTVTHITLMQLMTCWVSWSLCLCTLHTLTHKYPGWKLHSHDDLSIESDWSLSQWVKSVVHQKERAREERDRKNFIFGLANNAPEIISHQAAVDYLSAGKKHHMKVSHIFNRLVWTGSLQIDMLESSIGDMATLSVWQLIGPWHASWERPWSVLHMQTVRATRLNISCHFHDRFLMQVSSNNNKFESFESRFRSVSNWTKLKNGYIKMLSWQPFSTISRHCRISGVFHISVTFTEECTQNQCESLKSNREQQIQIVPHCLVRRLR